MLKKHLNTALTLIVLLSVFVAEAQNGKRMVFDFKKQFCSYYGENTPTTAIYTFASDNEAKQALARIMQVTGLPTN